MKHLVGGVVFALVLGSLWSFTSVHIAWVVVLAVGAGAFGDVVGGAWDDRREASEPTEPDSTR